MNTDRNKNKRVKSPFRGMLIFAIILFIVAWLVYRNWTIAPTVKPGNTDNARSSINSRDTTHKE